MLRSTTTPTPAEFDQYDALIQTVFGFSFAPWYRRGLWTADYTSHAIVDGGVMLSNISTYRMEMILGGRRQLWLQLGAVATREEARGQGFSRRLMEHVLATSPSMPMFLNANETVLDFYPRFGFRPVEMRQPVIEPPFSLPGAPAVPLAPTDPRVWDILTRRIPTSRILSCTNAAPIVMFHLLMEFPDAIYHLPALDALAVADPHGEMLDLYDLILTHPAALDEILPHLPFPGARLILCHFNPDGLGAPYHLEPYEGESTFFARGGWDPGGDFLLPVLIAT